MFCIACVHISWFKQMIYFDLTNAFYTQVFVCTLQSAASDSNRIVDVTTWNHTQNTIERWMDAEGNQQLEQHEPIEWNENK